MSMMPLARLFGEVCPDGALRDNRFSLFSINQTGRIRQLTFCWVHVRIWRLAATNLCGRTRFIRKLAGANKVSARFDTANWKMIVMHPTNAKRSFSLYKGIQHENRKLEGTDQMMINKRLIGAVREYRSSAVRSCHAFRFRRVVSKRRGGL